MSQSINWKLGTFSVIALMLTLGLFAGSALAGLTVDVPTGDEVIAGSFGNRIELVITLSGNEKRTVSTIDGYAGEQDITIVPPSGGDLWSEMFEPGAVPANGVADADTTVTGAESVNYGVPARGITITPTVGATEITVIYGDNPNGARAGNKIRFADFDITSATGTNAKASILVDANGSGRVSFRNPNGPPLDLTLIDFEDQVFAGELGQTFNFYYSSIGTRTQNPEILDGGLLTLDLPTDFPPATASNITVFSLDPDGADNGIAPPNIGNFTISNNGRRVNVPLKQMDGGETIRIRYRNVSVPRIVKEYAFPIQVKDGSLASSLTVVRAVKEDGSVSSTTHLSLDVTKADRGSGTVDVIGGPVSAGSTGNEIQFIFKPAGLMDGGGIELFPEDDNWTEPTGAAGNPGYTTVTVTGNAVIRDFRFDKVEDKDKENFTGKGIGIVFDRLGPGDTVIIKYGAGGGINGAKAPTDTGRSFFEFFSAPGFPIGNEEDDAKGIAAQFLGNNRPFVSIGSGDGGGDVDILVLDRLDRPLDNDDDPIPVNLLDNDVFSDDRITFSGEKTTVRFVYEADAAIRDGFFSITLDPSWTAIPGNKPSSSNTRVVGTETSAVTDPPIFVQDEIRIPIDRMQGGQKITVEYGTDDKEAIAPEIPETSAFTFKSQGTPNGQLTVIDPEKDDEDTADDDTPHKIEVKQAKDGSGTATILEDEEDAKASDKGKKFTIKYTAAGFMDGGKISLSSPGIDAGANVESNDWTPIEDHISISSKSAGVNLTNRDFDDDLDGKGRTVTFDITKMRRNDTVTFTYSNVDIQPTKEDNVKIVVKTQGDDGNDRNLIEIGESPEVDIDVVADGAGEAEIKVAQNDDPDHANSETFFARDDLTDFGDPNDDLEKEVPASHGVDITITYKATGELGALDNLGDPVLAEFGRVRVTMPAPSTFSIPRVDDTKSEADDQKRTGYVTVRINTAATTIDVDRKFVEEFIFGKELRIEQVTAEDGTTFEGLFLQKDDTVVITYNNVRTPRGFGEHTFLIESRGKEKDRGYAAIKTSPKIKVGTVTGGKGEAEITLPAPKDDVRSLIANSTGEIIKIQFKAVGPMDGGKIKVEAPFGWSKPTNDSTKKGFVRVIPSSAAVNLGVIDFPADPNDNSFTINLNTMRNNNQLTIEYGSGGGNKGVDVPDAPTGPQDFLVETRMPDDTDPTPITPDDVRKLQIDVKEAEGSGSIVISPQAVEPGTAQTLTFTYTAETSIETVRIVLPNTGDWPPAQGASSGTAEGRISVSRGDLTSPPDSGFSGEITVENLDLSAGQSVTIRYNNVTIPNNIPNDIGPHEFAVFSATTGISGSQIDDDDDFSTRFDDSTVFLVSPVGSGKIRDLGDVLLNVDNFENNFISPTDKDTEVDITNPDAVRSGSAVDPTGEDSLLNFYYGLRPEEFIYNGEVEVRVPSGWTQPTTSGDDGEVEALIVDKTTLLGIDVNRDGDIDDDDKPPITISGSSIIVGIRELSDTELVKISYKKGRAPASVEDSQFDVRAKSRSTGSRGSILRNIGTGSRAFVQVKVIGTSGGKDSGSATSNIPGSVASGSNDNTFQVRFVADVEFEDGSEIHLRIPTGWSEPQDNDDDDNPRDSAHVQVDSTGKLFDFDKDGDSETDEHLILPSDPDGIADTIIVKLEELTRNESVTITYGAGKNKAEAQGTKEDDVVFLILAKGHLNADIATVVDPPEDGKFKLDVTEAPPGAAGVEIIGLSSTGGDDSPVPVGDDDLSDPARDAVFADDIGIEIIFEITAFGQMDGGAIRLIPPTGFTRPQGTPNSRGFTESPQSGAQGNIPSLGFPTFDGTGATFPVRRLRSGQTVQLIYGSNKGGSGARAPKTKAVGDNAPKFRIETQGSSGGFTVAKEIPIDIVDARDGTGTARISPDTTTAGKKQNYVITYTARGTLEDAGIIVEIPGSDTPGATTFWDVILDDEDKISVSSDGDIKFDFAKGHVSVNDRTITVPIEKLDHNDRIIITLKDARAQPTEKNGDDLIDKVIFPVRSYRDDNFAGNAVELLGSRRASIGVDEAGDGSGTHEVGGHKTVVRAGSKPGDIVFTFNPVGTMLEKGKITLFIPDPWPAPTKDADKEGTITLSGSLGAGNLSVSSRTATAKIPAAGLDHNDTVIFTYEGPTAPPGNKAGDYEFTMKSSSGDRGPVELTEGSPVITVSPSGDGSGRIVIDEDSVRAADDAFEVEFTYTAVQTISGGELRVKFPSGWDKAKDHIFDLNDNKNKVTFRFDQDDTASDDDNRDTSLADDDRTLVIPITSLLNLQQIKFKFKGKVQNTASSRVEFTTLHKRQNAGTLTPLATQPGLKVDNVDSGKGTATVSPLSVASSSQGNQITIDVKAEGTMDTGGISVELPTGEWSDFSLTPGVQGFTTVSRPLGGFLGTHTLSSDKRTLTIPVQTLAPNQIVRVVYGSGSGDSGAVAQANAGGATFIIRTQGKGGEDFKTIDNQPTLTVTGAPDGSGRMDVSPATVSAGSVVEIVFTYSPAGTVDEGKIQMTPPDPWPGFTGSNTDVETDEGAVLGEFSFSGQSVTVPVSSLIVGQTVRIKYTVTIPSAIGKHTFNVKFQGLTDDEGGQLVDLISLPPEITVTPAGDGSGNARLIVRGPVTAGGVIDRIIIRFTAVGPMNNGAVSVDLPDDWSPPEGLTTLNPSDAGTLSFDGQTVSVSGLNLDSGDELDIRYQNGTAQGDAGDAIFIVKSKGSEAGTLTKLFSLTPDGELSLQVGNATDGSGTMVADPSVVVRGEAANIDFIYTLIGTITSGLIRLTVPDEWTQPQRADIDGPGFIRVQSDNALVQPAVVQNRTVTVQISGADPGDKVVISYKKAVAPSSTGVWEFPATSRGSATGGDVTLAQSPTVITSLEASVLAISSEPQTIFKGQVSGPITIETRLDDGSLATTTNGAAVNLLSTSSTGLFDTASDGDFDGTVNSVTIPAGQTSVNVYYKDPVAGTATLTATAPSFPAETQTATQDIIVADTASKLVLSSAGSFFAGDSLEVMVETQDASGNAAPSTGDVTVGLESSSTEGTFEPTSVTILAGETSTTVSYMDTTIGMATLTASADGLTDATHEVTVKDIDVIVSPSSAKDGDTVTVTATGKENETATFSVTTTPLVDDKAMTEGPDGTYVGEFPVTSAHAEGTFDVVVTIGASSKTVTGGLVIDNTAPVLTDVAADKTTIKNGQTLTLTAKSETGLDVWVSGVSALDTTQADRVDFVESDMEAGTYSASIDISEDNTAENGEKTLTVEAMDSAGNVATSSDITVDLRNFAEFDLHIPQGIGLIHIPLKVKELNSVGDVFDALGDDVDFLITYDPENAKWLSYLSNTPKGAPADQTLTDDMGIISVMSQATTVRLKGDALGTDGKSSINLSAGTNLIGVPLKDSRVNVVSDLLELDGIKDNAAAIIVSDEGTFKVVARAGDDGDIAITGGQSFIITASQDSTTEITGDAWDNVSGSVSGAPSVAITGLQVGESTPVLVIQGAVVDEITNAAKADFRVTVKNLSTGASVNAVAGSEDDKGGYNMTFVDTKSGRAVQVGDVLEISVESQNPLIGVQPLRHIVSTDDVKNSQIQLEDLIAYEIPAETELLLNYPNPFNPETWIAYRLAEDASVTLTIYDMTGKVVRAIQVGYKPAAVYESRDKAIYWDGRNNFGERVASGIYFYNLSTGEFTATQKMVILK